LFVRIPVQDPPPTDVSAAGSLMQVLRQAQQIQKKQGDSHLAVDHVLLALSEEKVLYRFLFFISSLFFYFLFSYFPIGHYEHFGGCRIEQSNACRHS